MSKNKFRGQSVEVTSDPFPTAATTPDAPPTVDDRRLRMLAGLGLLALWVACGAARMRIGGLHALALRMLSMPEVDPAAEPWALIRVVVDHVAREWGE